jgi:hypothetical protein
MKLSASQQHSLIETLKTRFEKNTNRHKGILWTEVINKLKTKSELLGILYQMEETGGEPDVVVFDSKSKNLVFVDCAEESPKGRRSLCYDDEALNSRKENKPKGSALGMAKKMCIEVLNEDEYRNLQKLGSFDTKTSSWIKTPTNIRELGGAIFCDRRFNTVFTYHNGAESYYAARAFRGKLVI